ncbi:hypothetical protein NDU88_005496 [Pleurodeles waltl]|uniref:Uncharacterized protein n=1 Tax=Pleurodeles waltl TaxID=8319 RepID=A0AAV7WC42_PLEWA|nr:hypothetical protein NDU88_005496 [Pleurodeles waltl]
MGVQLPQRAVAKNQQQRTEENQEVGEELAEETVNPPEEAEEVERNCRGAWETTQEDLLWKYDGYETGKQDYHKSI